jgi:hypothetical protein
MEAQQGFDSWFCCDECHKAINGGAYRYDCNTCDNFSFCEKCYKKNTKHTHKFKKAKVAVDEGPPANNEELIAQSYMLCSVCKDCLIDTNKRAYICKQCSPDIEAGNIVYWCNKCKESTDHEHTREKYKGITGAPEPSEDK